MEERVVLQCRSNDKVVLRIAAIQPFSSEFTSEQLNIIADIAEHYGSGQVHVTARQTVEVPDVPIERVNEITEILQKNGLRLGSVGNVLRNVIACSRWCLYNVSPMSDLACQLNAEYLGYEFPGKTTISLSGCDFSCVRSRTSDIGVIARADIELTEKQCKHCKLCIKDPLGCQVDAIELTDDGVVIDRQRCVRCGFCWNVCRPGTIKAEKTYFDVFVGGKGGIKPREAYLLTSVEGEETLKKLIGIIVEIYKKEAKEGERIADLIERKGLEVFNV